MNSPALTNPAIATPHAKIAVVLILYVVEGLLDDSVCV